jgi:hypothetical protein
MINENNSLLRRRRRRRMKDPQRSDLGPTISPVDATGLSPVDETTAEDETDDDHDAYIEHEQQTDDAPATYTPDLQSISPSPRPVSEQNSDLGDQGDSASIPTSKPTVELAAKPDGGARDNLDDSTMHVSQTSDQANALREHVSGDVVPTSGQKDRLDESAPSSERAVAAREAEAEDKVMDALAARIGERVMTKLSHMTDRIVDVLAERVAAKVMQRLTEME